jgi:hypothetical protein
MYLQYEREPFARWTTEAKALNSFGMTTGDLTLVSDGDSHPELAQHVFSTLIRS